MVSNEWIFSKKYLINFNPETFFIIKPFRTNKDIHKKPLSNVLYFKNKKILIVDSAAVYLQDEKPDILLLTHSPKLNLERLFISWKPEQVVVDGTNFKTYSKVWKATCRKEKIPFHDTAEKGFFKL